MSPNNKHNYDHSHNHQRSLFMIQLEEGLILSYFVPVICISMVLALPF